MTFLCSLKQCRGPITLANEAAINSSKDSESMSVLELHLAVVLQRKKSRLLLENERTHGHSQLVSPRDW